MSRNINEKIPSADRISITDKRRDGSNKGIDFLQKATSIALLFFIALECLLLTVFDGGVKTVCAALFANGGKISLSEALEGPFQGIFMTFAASAVLFMLGVLMVFIFTSIQRYLAHAFKYVFYGEFMILLSICLYSIYFLYKSLNVPNGLMISVCICFAVTPVPFLAALRYNTTGAVRTGVDLLLILEPVSYLLSILMYFADVISFAGCITIYTVMQGIVALFGVSAKIYNLTVKKDREEALAAAGLCILVITGILELFGVRMFDICSVFIGAILDVILVTVAQYSRLRKALISYVEKTNQLEQTKTRLVISQMRPHFIYNTLGSIRLLIKKDPDKAYNALYDFTKYLRHNIDSIDSDEPIPFERELEHVKTYVEIEKMRFNTDIDVRYNVSYTAFVIPPLTVQIFVENAIKHGMSDRENGSIVVNVYATDNMIYIEINDNGDGFDTKVLSDPSAQGSSVGIRNTVYRITNMMKGSCDIKSEIGKGTKVTVKIPRNDRSEMKESNKTTER